METDSPGHPLVVGLAGTQGLAMLLAACKGAPWHTVGVVPPANAGAAFARLHSALGTTADEVLIPTLDRVEVRARLTDGTELLGEPAITQRAPGSAIERVVLVSEGLDAPDTGFRTTPEVLQALHEADAIVIGPGSLYTNLIPALLIPEINEAIRLSSARKVFVCNLMTQPNQTDGYSIGDHVHAIHRHCSFRLDYVLAHVDGSLSAQVLERYEQSSAQLVGPQVVSSDSSQVLLFPDSPQQMRLIDGAILIQQDLAAEVLERDRRTGQERPVVRHHPEKLGQALRALLSDYALQRQLSVSRAIFREYDIRGLVGVELTATALDTLGRAFGTYMQRRTGRRQIVIGRDVRPSSEPFSDAAGFGLIASGCEVIDIGAVPTPLTSFAVNHFHVDGAVQITASHNPPEFNGLKLQVGMEALAGQELQHLERLIANKAFAVGSGDHLVRDVTLPYLEAVLNKVQLTRSLRVALDAGNGVAGPLAVRLLRELGSDVVPLFCEPDGTFPNHPPDPSEEANLAELKRAVVRERCDVGIALDGDGDRIAIVDEQGRMVSLDQMLLLYTREALRGRPGKAVFEVRCSELLFDGVRKYGGIPVMARCGNTSILPRMQQERAVIGGELSGHVFFDDPPIVFDDGLYAAALLLSYLDRSSLPVSKLMAELVEGLPHYYSSPEIRVSCPDYRKWEVVAAVREAFAGRFPVIDIDGARIYFDEKDWALIRASNTSPKLSLRFEGVTPDSVARMQAEVYQELQRHLLDLTRG